MKPKRTPHQALVYILAFHLLQPVTHPHHISWSAQNDLARSILSPSTGSSLLALVSFLGLASDWLFRKNRREALYYSIATIAFAAFSLALITLFGFSHKTDHGATWVYLGYAVLAAALAWRIDRSQATWLAIALLAFATVQAIVFRYPLGQNTLDRWTLASLLHASILLAGMLLTRLLAKNREHAFTRPFSNGALLSSIIASALIVIALIFIEPMPSLTLLAIRAGWIAVILLAISILYISPTIFSAFQIALAVGVVLATLGTLQHQPWFTSADHPLLHPWTLQSAAIALALLSVAWTVFRLAFRRFADRLWAVLNPPWPMVDSTIAYIALAIFLISSVLAILPAVAHELANSNSPNLAHFSSLTAANLGPRAWILFSTSTLALFASLWIKFRRTAILSIFLALTGASAMAAAHLDPQTSSASAFRWLLAMLLLLGSIILWLRQPIAQVAQRAHWPEFEYERENLAELFRPTLLALTVLPILAITFYSAAMALTGIQIVGPAPASFFARIGNSISYLVPLALMILKTIEGLGPLHGYGIARRIEEVSKFRLALNYGTLYNRTLAGNGHTVRTMTNPDSSTQIETYFQDGSLLSVLCVILRRFLMTLP